MEKKIYTIGYSAFSIDEFVELLKSKEIDVVIDVRSVPKSSYFKDFDKEVLLNRLSQERIYYRNYAAEFGARQTDPKYLMRNGCVDFVEFSKSDTFHSGIEKIEKGIEMGFTFILLCAEKKPWECHRSILITREMRRQGFDVFHILADKNEIGQSDVEKRLLDQFYPTRAQISLLEPITREEDLIKECYIKKNLEIGFKTGKMEGEGNYDE